MYNMNLNFKKNAHIGLANKGDKVDLGQGESGTGAKAPLRVTTYAGPLRNDHTRVRNVMMGLTYLRASIFASNKIIFRCVFKRAGGKSFDEAPTQR